MGPEKRVWQFAACLLVLVCGWLVPLGCVEDVDSGGRIGVVVTILPQVEFVEKVGGDKVHVILMVEPGQSPHTYAPKPSQMAEVADADIYAKVGSGVEFELVWMDKIVDQNKGIMVVDCSRGVELHELAGEDYQEGGGEGAEGHDHGAMDPHIWMSPLNAVIMVRNICDGLVDRDPGNAGYYEANRDAYIEELTQLDEEIREGFFGVTNRKFMVYHPAFGYFAREYGLTMLPIEEEGKDPTPAGLAHLTDQARENNIKVVFAEPQFDPRSAEVIADAIGGRVVLIDPLAKDYVTNLRMLLHEMAQAME